MTTSTRRQARADPRGSERAGAGRRGGSDARIRAALPTMRLAMTAKARVIAAVASRAPGRGQVRPKSSRSRPWRSGSPSCWASRCRCGKDWLNGVDCAPGEVVLCENVRFNKGEKKDDEDLARKMAALCDVFVMDAFGTAHRAEASTHGVATFAPVACAGPLLVGELEALERALEKPARPLVAIVAGSKVSTKLTVLETLLDEGRQAHRRRRHRQHVPRRAPASRWANRCTSGHARHRRRADRAGAGARHRDPAADRRGGGDESSRPRAHADVRAGRPRCASDEMILDIGPDTRGAVSAQAHRSAGTIIWNGPVGVFEFDQFGEGHARDRARRSRAARRFRSPAAAIPSRRSRSTASRTASPTSPPAAARSSSSSRARRCRRWRVLEQRAGQRHELDTILR